MKHVDVVLALTGKSRALLRQLRKQYAIIVPRLNDCGALELMQHKLAGSAPDKGGHRLYITERGIECANVMAADNV